MPYITDWSPSDPLQLMIYSKSKTGKTWGALTAPRPVVFDFDRGIATARNPEFVAKWGIRPIFYETFIEKTVTNGRVTSHNAYDDACRFFDVWVSKTTKKYKDYDAGYDLFDTFIIDSGTTLSEMAMNKAVIALGGMKRSQTMQQAATHGVLAFVEQDYGSERSLTERFIEMVRSAGKNFILICHEKELTNSAGGVTAVVPLLTGQSAERVPLKFDEVYHLNTTMRGHDAIRTLLTTPDGIHKVGSRYGVPNGTAWDWPSLVTALTAIKQAQHKEPS